MRDSLFETFVDDNPCYSVEASFDFSPIRIDLHGGRLAGHCRLLSKRRCLTRDDFGYCSCRSEHRIVVDPGNDDRHGHEEIVVVRLSV